MSTILVKGLGKAYKSYPSRWAKLSEWIFSYCRKRHSLKWVLSDINFTVNSGESMAIIGMNGAGKSTLLKIIAGTVQPTCGFVSISGKVTALLELGMGFHQDFTGRQNVYMACQLLGYSPKDIDELMPEINSFSEIGDYLDQPIRVYSSGMQMRLAFSVATARRPDILIVDEALSVGDAYFQHKSFGRIRDFQQQGTTLLIVSHDKEAIQTICNKAILINNGTLVMEGRPENVFNYYNALLSDAEGKNIILDKPLAGVVKLSSGDGGAHIKSVLMLNEASEKTTYIKVGQKVSLLIDIELQKNLDELVVGYEIKNRLGISIYGTNTHHLKYKFDELKNEINLFCTFTFFANLGPGSYSVSVALHKNDTHIEDLYEWQDNALIFEVVSNGCQFVGLNWLPTSLKVNRSE
jgi:lipopolysaccharide transport system ATP-binding protein